MTVFVRGLVNGDPTGAYMVGSITDDGIGAARSVDGIRMQIACVSYLQVNSAIGP